VVSAGDQLASGAASGVPREDQIEVELSQAGKVEVKVVTEIRPPDIQAGMKSTQIVVVDTNAGQIVSHQYDTGVTDVGITELDSRLDRFSATLTKSEIGMSLRMTGETGSKAFPANINYDLTFKYSPSSRTFSLASGTHDGYPSYIVSIDRSIRYDYSQGNIMQLFGCCDVRIRP
jgi:hypothetical protein